VKYFLFIACNKDAKLAEFLIPCLFSTLYSLEGVNRISYFCKPKKERCMLINVFKSKIHRVKVTQAELNYVGSITIDEDLLEAAGIRENEKVQIVNNNNGERLETYAIKGRRGSGVICLNGAAARKAQPGDIVIIISYAWMTPEEADKHQPVVIFPDENNRIVR
jgi:aspartate 1-decarboxylase